MNLVHGSDLVPDSILITWLAAWCVKYFSWFNLHIAKKKPTHTLCCTFAQDNLQDLCFSHHTYMPPYN